MELFGSLVIFVGGFFVMRGVVEYVFFVLEFLKFYFCFLYLVIGLWEWFDYVVVVWRFVVGGMMRMWFGEFRGKYRI